MTKFDLLAEGVARGFCIDGQNYLRLPSELYDYDHGRGVWYELTTTGFRYLGDEKSRGLEREYQEQTK